MKRLIPRVWIFAVCLMLAAAPLALAELPVDSPGVLGIGLSTFWPFDAAEKDKSFPRGLDSFIFRILARNVQPGEGALEIHPAENDSVAASVNVKEMTFTYGTVTNDGVDTPYTDIRMRLDKPLDEQGRYYLTMPAGAFVSDGTASNEYGSPEDLIVTVEDCGFADYQFADRLAVGDKHTLHVLIGSAKSVRVETTGIVSADPAELTADGDIAITAAEKGEGGLYVDFFDAEGGRIAYEYFSYTFE